MQNTTKLSLQIVAGLLKLNSAVISRNGGSTLCTRFNIWAHLLIQKDYRQTLMAQLKPTPFLPIYYA